MEILIDGREITNKKDLFACFKKQINSNEFYGDNLDALWDVLCSVNEDIKVKIINYEDLKRNLGDYIESLMQLLEDIKFVNARSRVYVEEKL